jgi:hypothetical protein
MVGQRSGEGKNKKGETIPALWKRLSKDKLFTGDTFNGILIK